VILARPNHQISSLGDGVEHVLALRSGPQMARISTNWLVAFMADRKRTGIGAVKKPVSVPMSSAPLTGQESRHTAVSMAGPGVCPRPTGVRPAALVKHAPEFAILGTVLTYASPMEDRTALGADLFP
jgi:hypothetical protein